LLRCDLDHGKFFSSSLSFRGNIDPKEVKAGINYLKEGNELDFSDMSNYLFVKSGIKFAVANQAPSYFKDDSLLKSSKAVSNIVSSSAIIQKLKNLLTDFDKLFGKRAYVSSFIANGMEEGEFSEAREDMQATLDEYQAWHEPTEWIGKRKCWNI